MLLGGAGPWFQSNAALPPPRPLPLQPLPPTPCFAVRTRGPCVQPVGVVEGVDMTAINRLHASACTSQVVGPVGGAGLGYIFPVELPL